MIANKLSKYHGVWQCLSFLIGTLYIQEFLIEDVKWQMFTSAQEEHALQQTQASL